MLLYNFKIPAQTILHLGLWRINCNHRYRGIAFIQQMLNGFLTCCIIIGTHIIGFQAYYPSIKNYLRSFLFNDIMDLIFLSKSWRKNYAFDLLLEHGIQYLVGNFRLTKSTAVKYLITIGTKVLFYIQRYRSEKGVSNIFYN